MVLALVQRHSVSSAEAEAVPIPIRSGQAEAIPIAITANSRPIEPENDRSIVTATVLMRGVVRAIHLHVSYAAATPARPVIVVSSLATILQAVSSTVLADPAASTTSVSSSWHRECISVLIDFFLLVPS